MSISVLIHTLCSCLLHLQHGSLDEYLLKTDPELLGWEGMRVRMAVKDTQALKAAQVAPQPIL